jgi:hypothetical protein
MIDQMHNFLTRRREGAKEKLFKTTQDYFFGCNIFNTAQRLGAIKASPDKCFLGTSNLRVFASSRESKALSFHFERQP